MRIDYLIIGGGIAGVTAAEHIRQRDAVGTIRILGEEKHALYSRVLLPHVVRGRVPEEKAYLKAPNALSDKQIEFSTGVRVTRVDAARHVVVTDSGEELTYGKLLIATGGSVRTLDVPGAKEAGCISFQTIDDARALRDSLGASKALVYGGGFIALEMVMSYVHNGAPVTVVMRGDGFFSRVLDPRSKAKLLEAMKAKGVEVILHAQITGVETNGNLKTVFLSDGSKHVCTALATGIGIVPNVAFLEGSGIPVADGILADDHLRSSAPDVYVAGDVAEFDDRALGMRHIVGNWQNAMFQGRVAGANMAGEETAFEAVTAYGITVFDIPVAFIGATDVPVDERIVRETEKGASLQLLVKGGRVVGATSVGLFTDRTSVNRLLATKTSLSDAQLAALRDSRIPLDSVLG